MNMTDPIADMLTRLRNGAASRHDFVLIPNSRMKTAIAKILKDEGFVRDFEVLNDNPQGTLKVYMNYLDRRTCAISGLKRVSKPGRRVYVSAQEAAPIRKGLGIHVLSTPKGILVDREAQRAKVGGELICTVW